MICQVKGCKRKVRVTKHGLCEAHLRRLYRTGKVGGGKLREYKKREPFKITEDQKDLA